MADERCGRCMGEGWLTSWEDRVRCPECRGTGEDDAPPPVAAREEPKRFHSGEQVFEHYVPGYKRPEAEPSPYAREEQGARGTWPERCEQRAFVAGASWWEYHKTAATMWPSDRDLAEAEAVRLYGEPAAPPAPAALPELLEDFLNPPNDVVMEVGRRDGAEHLSADAIRAHARGVIAARIEARFAALAQRAAELEADLANATGGFDAAMELADAEQERAKAAEQRVRDLEGALLKYGHHDILCAEHVVHTETWGGGCICGWLELDAALRGTGEGNR